MQMKMENSLPASMTAPKIKLHNNQQPHQVDSYKSSLFDSHRHCSVLILRNYSVHRIQFLCNDHNIGSKKKNVIKKKTASLKLNYGVAVYCVADERDIS